MISVNPCSTTFTLCHCVCSYVITVLYCDEIYMSVTFALVSVQKIVVCVDDLFNRVYTDLPQRVVPSYIINCVS